MKKIILPIISLIGFVLATHAQCGKNIVFASSKTDYLDAHDSLQRSANESVNVAIRKTDITVIINEDAETKLTGTGTLTSCDWKVPFKDGKMVLKAQLTDVRGDSKNVTMTIVGKDGKATLLVEIETMPDRKMRLTADEFDERN